MNSCPFCDSRIENASAVRCPQCGRALTSVDPNATLDNAAFLTPNHPSSDTSGTIDTAGILTVHSNSSMDTSTPQTSETLSGSDPNQTLPDMRDRTIDLSLSSQPTLIETNRVDIDQTLASPPASGTVNPSSSPTIANSPRAILPLTTDGRIDQTIDSFASSPTLDLSGAATYDSLPQTREFSPAQSPDSKRDASRLSSDEALRNLWDRAAPSVDDPNQSLKAEGNTADRSLLASVAKRSFAESAKQATNTDYELIQKIGAGGMGVVYSAKQRAINRVVALKLIKNASQQSVDSKEKFLYEAQITGDLDHPNIVPVHDLGSNQDGTLFYSMKLVSGTPWNKEILKRSRDENIDIWMKVADAIAFAHSRKIIHRDLKPENVMLGKFGEVLVMDWGLAIQLDSRQSFQLGGTPAYMAPEMAIHRVSDIGYGSDIYLLGAILFEIIVGKPPHPGSNVTQCLLAAARNQLIQSDKKDPLLDVARKALESEVADRFSSVAAMQEAVREVCRHNESIILANRYTTLLDEAIAQQDYSKFSKSLFGFEESLQMWPANQAAITGLRRGTITYAQCAYDKSDFDLCLGILNPTDEAHRELHEQASVAKKRNLLRERRLRNARRTLAAVVSTACILLTAFASYALWQKSNATAQANIAEQQRDVADKKRLEADEQRAQALTQKSIADKQRELADLRRIEVERQKQIAEDNADLARQNALSAKIGNYQSRLSLAFAQANQFDVIRSLQSLEEIRDLENDLRDSTTHPPKLLTWPYQRIALLNNVDVDSWSTSNDEVVGEHSKPTGVVTSFSYAPAKQTYVTSYSDGRIIVQALPTPSNPQPESMVKRWSAPISVAAIDPGGDWVVLNLDTRAAAVNETPHSVYVWSLRENTIEPIPQYGRCLFKGMEFSPDGKWFAIGVNQGISVVPRNEKMQWDQATQINVRGDLLQMSFISDLSDQPSLVALTRTLESERFLYRCSLDTFKPEAIVLPNRLSRTMTAFASQAEGALLIGTELGEIWRGRIQSDPDTPVVIQLEEPLQPQVHKSPIQQLKCDKDNWLFSRSDEPVIHVWQAVNDPKKSWIRQTALSGFNRPIEDFELVYSRDNPRLRILATDVDDTVRVWDLNDQINRRQWQVASLPVPAIAISDRGIAETVNAIDRNGVLHLWSNGEHTTSYIGHTPGAEIIDVAVNTKSSWIASLARLPSDGSSDLYDHQPDCFEIIAWDLSTPRMLRRIHLPPVLNTSPRLTTLDGSESLWIAMEAATYLVRPRGEATPLKFEQQSVLVIPNPRSKHEVFFLGDAGQFNRVQLPADESQISSSMTLIASESALADRNIARSTPIAASFNSARNNHLYLLLQDGVLARFDVTENSVRFHGATKPMELIALASRSDFNSIDLSVSSNETSDRISIIHRPLGLTSPSRLLTITWTDEQSQPDVPNIAETPRNSFMMYRGENMTFGTVEAIDPKQDVNRIVRPTNDGSLLLLSKDGFIERVLPSSPSPISRWGRAEALNASYSQTTDLIAMVSSDRRILFHSASDPWRKNWEVMSNFVGDFTDCQLSPAGTYLFTMARVLETDGNILKLWDLSNLSEPVAVWDSVAAATWHTDGKSILWMDQSGRLNTRNISTGVDRQLDTLQRDTSPSGSGDRIESLAVFKEPWNLQQVSEVEYVAVLLSNESDSTARSRIVFLRGPYASDNSQDKATKTEDYMEPIVSNSRITALAASPNSSILVTGDENGSLNVWFASPTIDRMPHELLTLEGHRGSGIRTIAFSADGNTIYSADQSGRVIGWRSAVAKERSTK